MAKKIKKCTESEFFTACRIPKVDLKEHRKKIKAYLKGFNKAIEKAIKDDKLVLRIELTDSFDMDDFSSRTICRHEIKFIDNQFIKL